MPTRIVCDALGLEGNWIDVADKWTQREIAELNTAADDAFFAILQRKAVACHVEATPELIITDPAPAPLNTILVFATSNPRSFTAFIIAASTTTAVPC
jgi:hypothetical protein